MPFRYQAIDSKGQTVANTVEASSVQQAAEMLREKGLFVTRIDAEVEDKTDLIALHKGKASGKLKDVIFFTQQMSMLLRSGARVVQAIEAIESQTQRVNWLRVIRRIRIEVEEGRPLSAALSQFPKLFGPIYVNMLMAGEASGNLGLAFERLATLTRQQMEIRNRVVGALMYPAVLMTLCVGVVATLFTFVLPRFAEMFKTLDVELPATTAIMINASEWARANTLYVVGGLMVIGGSLTMFLRSAKGKRFISRFTVRVPIFGLIVRNIILARTCRVWGQLLDSKVGLLDTVQLTMQSTKSLDFQELFVRVKDSITEGNLIGPTLKDSWLLPKTFAAAIATGEESGRLSDALLFVAGCLEDENTQVLSTLTRVIEPIMLVIMGTIVGTVAVSLFMPMFDMATVTGGK
jgi:type IV pilus assembly protein PilC